MARCYDFIKSNGKTWILEMSTSGVAVVPWAKCMEAMIAQVFTNSQKYIMRRTLVCVSFFMGIILFAKVAILSVRHCTLCTGM